MIGLNTKLAQLSDRDRAELYSDLLDRLGGSSRQSVRELVLVYEKSSSMDLAALREIAQSSLLEHERPTRFVATDKLPRTSHGKLNRRGLPGLIRTKQSEADESLEGVGLSDDVVSRAVETFRHLLDKDAIEPDSNFFEHGGHSLLAVECILELEEKIERRISITQFLNCPTPRGIAKLVKAQSAESHRYIYPVSENRLGLPVFVFSASSLAYALKRERPDWTIYGVQLRWRDENDQEIRYRNIEDLAARIAAEISELCEGDEFVLAGSSFPAMVAYAVARRLQASGIEPNLTLLIEPSLWYGIRTWVELDLEYHNRLCEGENHYLRWLLENNPLRALFWRRLRRLYRSRRAAAARSATSMSTREDFEAYEASRVFTLWRMHRPSPYKGKAALIAGAGASWQMRRNWEPRLGSGCSVHYVDTDHSGILKDPFMSEVVVPIVTKEIGALSGPSVSITQSA